MSGKDSVSGTHPDTIAIISATRVFWSCSCCTMYMHDLLPQIACTSIKIGGGGGGGGGGCGGDDDDDDDDDDDNQMIR